MHLAETSSHRKLWAEHFCAVAFSLFFLVFDDAVHVLYTSEKWIPETTGCINQLFVGNKSTQNSAVYDNKHVFPCPQAWGSAVH